MKHRHNNSRNSRKIRTIRPARNLRDIRKKSENDDIISLELGLWVYQLPGMTLEDLQNVYIRVLSKMENPYQVMILLVAMYKAVEQRQLPSIIFVLFCVLAIKFYPDECRPVVNRIFARLKNGDIVTTK